MIDLYVGQTLQKGRGVYTRTPIPVGTAIIPFTGPLVPRVDLPHPSAPHYEHYTQIDTDLYMGPSGALDDLINHSCDPNCGIRQMSYGFMCFAIRPIQKDEELSWDYASLQNSGWWSMQCKCGSPLCRGYISDFRALPPSIQEKYIRLRIVPHYILEEFGQTMPQHWQAGALATAAA